MRALRYLLPGLLALHVAGCASDDYYYGVPYYGAAYIPPYSYCYDLSCGGYSYYLTVPRDPGATIAVVCAPSDAACRLESIGTSINYYLRATLGPVEDLSKLGENKSGGIATYGPNDLPEPGGTRPVATFELTVKRNSDSTYAFKLEAKGIGAPDTDYQTVMVGSMTKGAVPNHGSGVLGIDVDALASANPSIFTGRGKLTAAFTSDGQKKATAFRLLTFQAATGADLVPNAIVVAHTTADGHSKIRAVANAEVLAPSTGGPDTATEKLLLFGTWLRGKGGRAAAVIAGGDVPTYTSRQYLLHVTCYAAAKNVVYAELFECSTTPTAGKLCDPLTDPPPGFNSGVATDCIAGTDLYSDAKPPTSFDAASAAQEAGAPFDPGSPPASMPVY